MHMKWVSNLLDPSLALCCPSCFASRPSRQNYETNIYNWSFYQPKCTEFDIQTSLTNVTDLSYINTQDETDNLNSVEKLRPIVLIGQIILLRGF